MSALIQSFDWARTPLGSISQWPQSLKTATNLMLNARQPMWIGWGPSSTFLYNDAYIPVLSMAKHPWALGKPAATVWEEIWDFCGPLADKVFQQGEASFVDDVRLFMNRGSFLEETFYSFSYSPVRDETGLVSGLFCSNTEVTAQNLNTRRLATLSALSANVLIEKTIQSACASAALALSQNPDDIPFALFYLTDASGQSIRLEQVVGLSPQQAGPVVLPVDESAEPNTQMGLPLHLVMAQGQILVSNWSLSDGIFLGPAEQVVEQAILLPLSSPGQARPFGVLVAGINPTRPLDADYRTFYELVTNQVATALQHAQAAEEERYRLHQLAELNRAKTLFFSNISHEFRTPLTLMLGPLEDLLREEQHSLNRQARTQVEAAYRNARRLLRLVNTLLDFSRLEGGRLQARFVPTDLPAFTADLASSFRSIIEKAGMQLVVALDTLAQPVEVDQDLWEKIVLNLLSNAFKFTLAGTITVRLTDVANGQIALSIQDTGVGIPADHLPRLFERFHRVEGSQGRSFEGTGIGLALVKELVELHGGTIGVESVEGQGSTFTIQVPVHQPQRVLSEEAPRPRSVDLFVADVAPMAEKTLPRTEHSIPIHQPAAGGTAKHILLVDDNADMRAYIHRLLEPDYVVTTAADGLEALQAVQERLPDLVLSDSMMPNLDGTALVRKLKAMPQTAQIPVMLLSARAGEEATLDGYTAGADDYLTKPFSANELLIRVRAQLRLAQSRQDHQQKLRVLFKQVPVAIAIAEGPSLAITLANDQFLTLVGRAEGQVLGHRFADVFPTLLGPKTESIMQRVRETGEPYSAVEQPLPEQLGAGVEVGTFLLQPLTDAAETSTGMALVMHDVTESVKARQQIEESQRQFEQLADLIPQIVWVAQPDGQPTYFNRQWYTFTATAIDAYLTAMHPDDLPVCMERWLRSMATGVPFQLEYRLQEQKRPGAYRWFLGRAVPVIDHAGTIIKWFGSATDIDEHKQAETALRESESRFRAIADTAPVLIRMAGTDRAYHFFNKGWLAFTGRSLASEVGNGWLTGIHPDDADRCLESYNQAFDQRQEWYQEYRIRRHDGVFRWVADRAKPWYAPDGTFMGYIGGGTDIHETRLATEELERLVVERTRELRNLNGELQRSNFDLMQFASVASHDLKEPLRKIQAFSSLLTTSLDGRLMDEEQDHFDRIIRAASRMQDMVDDVLRLSKLSRQDAPFEPVELNAILTRILDDLEIVIAEKQATITIHPLPGLEGLPGQLHQLFQNLISNALKFVGDQPPQVWIRTAPFTNGMREELGLPSLTYVLIEVVDNGIGFDMQYGEKIFGMFQRLHRRERYEGTGIGLTICRRIAENHHGAIRAISRSGQGATFQLILPLNQID